MDSRGIRLTAVFTLSYCVLTGVQAWAQELNIEILSSSPELVTGDDALVKISGVQPTHLIT